MEEIEGVVGSAGIDELEAKTQANPHQHPTSRQERKRWAQEMSRQYGIRYEK